MPRKLANRVDAEIGARIRMRRAQLGMSQEKLGAAIGVTFQQVQKYEKGSNRIGGSRLDMLARALGVTPAYFFPDDLTNSGEMPTLDTDVMKMALRIQAMPTVQRRSISTILDAIGEAVPAAA